jgi:hypothetical protein
MLVAFTAVVRNIAGFFPTAEGTKPDQGALSGRVKVKKGGNRLEGIQRFMRDLKRLQETVI